MGVNYVIIVNNGIAADFLLMDEIDDVIPG